MVSRLKNPEAWVRFSWCLFWYSIIGMASSHILIFLTQPPESSWVFHLLMNISWQALLLTAINNIVTADVRRQQEEDGE